MQHPDVIGSEAKQFFFEDASECVIVGFHHVYISIVPKTDNSVAVIWIVLQQHDVINFKSIFHEYGQLFFVLITQSRRRAL
ncbi:hypothetical protein D3C85_1511170 [compost metagenome]